MKSVTVYGGREVCKCARFKGVYVHHAGFRSLKGSECRGLGVHNAQCKGAKSTYDQSGGVKFVCPNDGGQHCVSQDLAHIKHSIQAETVHMHRVQESGTHQTQCTGSRVCACRAQQSVKCTQKVQGSRVCNTV